METRNIVPRNNNEGKIGTDDKKWQEVNAGTVTADNVNAGTVTADNVDLSFRLLKRNKAYKIGDIAYSPNLPSWARLECVVAGTTGDTEPDFSTIENGGGLINDGTATFWIDDTRDGTPVGALIWGFVDNPLYVSLSGGEFDKTAFPRLWRFINTNNLYDETGGNKAKFSTGSNDNMVKMPNFVGRYLQVSNLTNNLDLLEPALPNITGNISLVLPSGITPFTEDGGTGALYNNTKISSVTGYQSSSSSNISRSTENKLRIDASKANSIYKNSDTVQPSTVCLRLLMKA